MKVVHIYGNIINCEEIRNINFNGRFVNIHFKHSISPNDWLCIECASTQDAKDVMDIIYNEMVGE